MKKHKHITRVLDGQASLGRSNIKMNTLLVNGKINIPEGMEIDFEGGTVFWKDQQQLRSSVLYTFEFEHDALTPEDAIAEMNRKRDDKINAATSLEELKALLLTQ